eukprot:gene15634-18574_t
MAQAYKDPLTYIEVVFNNVPIPFASEYYSACTWWIQLSQGKLDDKKSTETIVREALDDAKIKDNIGELAAISSYTDSFGDALVTLAKHPKDADARSTVKSRSEILIATTRRFIEMCLANISHEGIAIPLANASYIYLGHLCDCMLNAEAWGYKMSDLTEFRKEVYAVAERAYKGLARYARIAGYTYVASKGDYDLSKFDNESKLKQRAIMYFRKEYSNPCFALDSERRCIFIHDREDKNTVCKRKTNYVLLPKYLEFTQVSTQSTCQGIGMQPAMLIGNGLGKHKTTIPVTCGGKINIRMVFAPKQDCTGTTYLYVMDDKNVQHIEHAPIMVHKDHSKVSSNMVLVENENNIRIVSLPELDADKFKSLTFEFVNEYSDIQFVQLEIFTN